MSIYEDMRVYLKLTIQRYLKYIQVKVIHLYIHTCLYDDGMKARVQWQSCKMFIQDISTFMVSETIYVMVEQSVVILHRSFLDLHGLSPAYVCVPIIKP